MSAELVVRFLLGGVIVSLFALAGELFKPKTFAGLFGAAPSVAIATLAIAYATRDTAYVSVVARSMLIGCVALFAYCKLCVALAETHGLSVWVGAVGAWAAWLGIAFGSLMVLRSIGVVT